MRRLAPALLAGAVFAVYAAGACRTIYVGDSGELVTAVHVLGIPHPTGYPLYVLLGKLWTLALPVGSIAWRMSLFGAACAAATCGLLWALGRAMGLGAVAATFAALLLALSPSFWGEANVQRVYPLAALFVVLATATAWRWWRRRDTRSLVGAFLVCGLGATCHAFMAVYALALVAWVLATEPALLREPRRLAAPGGALVAGLVPYLYLPLCARAHPVLAWGDPETVSRFVAVVTRRDFWHRAWLERPGDVVAIAGDWTRSVSVELTWAGAVLAVVGLFAARRRGWPVLLLVLATAGNVAALVVHGSRSDLFVWHRYYIPSYTMAALVAGLGCDVVVRRLPQALALLPLAVPGFLLVTGWARFDRSRYRLAEDFGLHVLEALPPGAHLVASDDNVLFALMYLHFVEGRRPDVDLVLQGVGGELRPLRFDPDTEPLFFVDHPNWRHPALTIVPVGLVFRAVRAGRAAPPGPPVPASLDGEHDPRVPKDYLTQNLIGRFHYMRGITAAERDWPRARRELAAAAAAAPDNDVLFYNLGLVYMANGLVDDALAAFRRSHAINPRPLVSAGRHDAADRVAEAQTERARLATIEARLADDPALRDLLRGSPAWHRELAALLARDGERAAARGHRLRALELDGSG